MEPDTQSPSYFSPNISLTERAMNIMDSKDKGPQVPQEISDAIIDLLDYDHLSLKNCALVSTLFAIRCQKHLFKRIKLERRRPILPEDSLPISKFFSLSQRLYKVLGDSPHLREYVKTLQISEYLPGKYAASWIHQDKTIAKILSMLVRLDGLLIGGIHPRIRLNFDSWNPDLKSAIALRAESLTMLSLSGMDGVPLSILCRIPALRTLHVSDIEFRWEYSGPPSFTGFLPSNETISSIPAKLDILVIKVGTNWQWATLYPWLRNGNSIDLTHITTLRLDIYFGPEQDMVGGYWKDMDAIAWVIRGCRDSLRSLSILYPDEVCQPMDKFNGHDLIDLSSMPRLQTLSLGGCVWDDTDFGGGSKLRWLIKNLQKIPKSPHLRDVTVACKVMDFQGISRSGLEYAGWEDFALVVLELAEIASVNIDVDILPCHGPYVKATLKQCLPALVDRGMVEFMEYV